MPRRVIQLTILAVASLCLVAPGCFAQSAALVQQFEKGPASAHLGPVEKALVVVEVAIESKDGATQPTRRATGLVLRCDGFVLVPRSLFGLSRSGTSEFADNQKVTVVLNPGTKEQRRVPGVHPRWSSSVVPYTVLKLADVHVPALRTLLPGTLKAGDSVQVAWAAWDPVQHGYRPLERHPARLAAANEKEKAPAGFIRFEEPVSDAPSGAVVLGPDGMAIGVAIAATDTPQGSGFFSFADLFRATNCVGAVPTPDSVWSGASGGVESARNPADPAPAAGGSDMVHVPGGPISIPAAVLRTQPDMQSASIACVAPFEIDRYEVTNRQYLAFLLGLPERERRNAALFPISWSPQGEPFGPEAADLPVLSVPLLAAARFAAAQGKRLPTPYEWCRAAFGPQGAAWSPDWMRKYVEDHNAAWARVSDLHVQYVATHSFINWRRFEGFGAGVAMPFLTMTAPTDAERALLPLRMEACRWSKDIIDGEVAGLNGRWMDSPQLQPGGTRAYDQSPFGVMDMVMNAAEVIVPNPGPPLNGGAVWASVHWRTNPQLPDRSGKPYWNGFLGGIRFPPAELDRGSALPFLVDRVSGQPAQEPVVTGCNIQEAHHALSPIEGWDLRLSGEGALAIQSAIGIGPTTAVLTRPGRGLWCVLPAHLQTATGRPIPISPPLNPLVVETLGSGADLGTAIYILPRGFRCAR